MFYIRQNNNIPFLTGLKEIPADYFSYKKFYLTCEWTPLYLSILSILPKLLKYRFPDCEVFIYSPEPQQKEFKLIFEDNPYVDSIINSITDRDFYKLNTVLINDDYRNLTYEDLLINQMLDFWKFEKNISATNLLPEIYFNSDDIDYVTGLNNAWCNGEKYLIVDIQSNDNIKRIIHIVESFQIKNIIVINIPDQNEILLEDYNILDLTEFIVPDKIILGLIKFSYACIGSSELFNVMRQKDNIYSTNSHDKLKNINYI